MITLLEENNKFVHVTINKMLLDYHAVLHIQKLILLVVLKTVKNNVTAGYFNLCLSGISKCIVLVK